MFYFKNFKPNKALIKRQKILQKLRDNNFSNLFHLNLDLDTVSAKNCENMVGSIEVPVGLVGPIKAIINGSQDEYILPLATTEGALVASANRGAKLINHSKEVIISVKRVGMSRAPVFKCQSHQRAVDLITTLKSNFKHISEIVTETSTHIEIKQIQGWTRGYLAYIRFVFDTDQAMGMNMVTKAVKQVCQKVISQNEDVDLISISGNVCCDKKANSINQLLGRGFKVCIEMRAKEKELREILKVSSQQLFQTHHYKNLIGTNVAQSLSQNMHAANMISAIYIATGQDPAHVVESSQCSLMIEKLENGLYLSSDMPNVNVGTVGGGTTLKAQRECVELIAKQKVSSVQLAGVVGLAVLCGEVSGLAALASHDLTQAHLNLGRKQ